MSCKNCNKCKKNSCSCKDKGYMTATTCPPSNDVCPRPEPCSEIFDTCCIVHNSDPIMELDIKEGDRLCDILQKIALCIKEAQANAGIPGRPILFIDDPDDISAFSTITGRGTGIWKDWAICDGTVHNGVTTPDLRDRFIVGAGSTYNVGDTGGVNSVTLTAAQSGLPAHTHTVNDPGHTHTAGGFVVTNLTDDVEVGTSQWRVNGYEGLSISSNTTGITIGSTIDLDASQSHENRPPYYALLAVKKVAGGDCESCGCCPNGLYPDACKPVTTLKVVSTTVSAINLIWNPVSSATNYLVEVKEVGTTTWNSIPLISQSYYPAAVIGGLLSNKEYLIRVTTICADSENESCTSVTIKTKTK
jgi:microcystin-dependent protein